MTLINRANFFVFQPLLADIISGVIETTHVVVPLRRMLKGVEVEVGYVEDIDTVRKRSPSAAGARTRPSGDLRRARDRARQRDRLPRGAGHGRARDRCAHARRRLLPAQPGPVDAGGSRHGGRRRPTTASVDLRRRGRGFHRRGGGSRTGGPAADRAKTFSEALEPEVVLVHGGPYVVPAFGERLGRYATKKLEQAGVRLVLGHRLVAVERMASSSMTARHRDRDRDQYRRQRPAPGGGLAESLVRPRTSVAGSRRTRRSPCPGSEHVWALGDCASIIDPAHRQAHARDGAARHPRGSSRRPQHPRGAGRASCRPRSTTASRACSCRWAGSAASARSGASRSPGSSPGSCGGSYYLLRLPSLERRIRVALDWALELFLPHDVIEINMRRTRTRPGEYVGEIEGEPVSAGARQDASDEIVI